LGTVVRRRLARLFGKKEKSEPFSPFGKKVQIGTPKVDHCGRREMEEGVFGCGQMQDQKKGG